MPSLEVNCAQEMGGMLGVASEAGRGWMTSAAILYLIAGVLAFVQRAVTRF